MNTASAILVYLVQTLFSLYLLAVLLRFILQTVRADFYNPISQFLVKVTAPLVNPLRRLIPGLGGLDLASLALALLVQMLGSAILVVLWGGTPNPVSLLMWSVVAILYTLLNIYFFALIAMIIVSWVAAGSRHPAIMLLYQITEPVMAPLRKVLPPMGGLDLSPILAFILIQVLRIFLSGVAASLYMPRGLVPGL
ncbi:MAG: YggT family protein [Pseudomonadota bacterium]